jgi:hypothetical protein
MPCTHHFTHKKDPVSTAQNAGWAAAPVYKAWKISPPPQFKPWIVQPIASHYTAYAVTATYLTCVNTHTCNIIISIYSNAKFPSSILT